MSDAFPLRMQSGVQGRVLLIGGESLTAKCGDLLLSAGFTVVALVSDTPKIQAWGQRHGLKLLSYAQITDAASQDLPPFDWILSVANLRLLPAWLLAGAKKGAINFHDGPLPQHGGLNAPVWALLAGNKTHAITWHLIEGGVDQGRILSEQRFTIAEDERALTLNTRCFEAALDSFPAVLAQMQSGLSPHVQSKGPRHMHRAADRPKDFGRIDWDQPPEQICRLVRALDHGSYPNPIATAKLDLGDRVLNVGSAEPLQASGPRGRVLAAGQEGLVVACLGGAIRLSRLTCQERGGVIDPLAVAAQLIGRDLPGVEDWPGGIARAEMATVSAEVAKAEAQILARLKAPMPLSLPFKLQTIAPARPDLWRSIAFPQPPLGPDAGFGADLAVLSLALVRALGQDCADFACLAQGVEGYVSDWRPLQIRAQGGVAQAITAAAAALPVQGADPAYGFALDLMTRVPGLKDLRAPQIALSHDGWNETSARLPAEVLMILSPKGLSYRDQAFTRAEVELFADRIWRVVRRILAAQPLDRLEAISVLSETEYTQAVHHWNQTAQSHDRSLMVHTAFEAQAAQTPDAIALAYQEETLSYADLNSRANQLAHRLIKMGVGPGVFIGIALRRSPDLIVAALAVQKAGGAYVPMDPNYPADRLALFAHDSQCPIIITRSDIGISLPEGPHLLALDQELGADFAPLHNPLSYSHSLGADPSLAPDMPLGLANPKGQVSPHDPAYLIYTSGSTGRPKGVVVEHRNVVNFFLGMDLALGRPLGLASTAAQGQPGVWMALTSLSFDISVLELFWTLARGYKVVILDDDNRALVSSGRVFARKPMQFSLYYWGNDDASGAQKYDLLLKGARFADQNGFCAIWTPERHFHAFGGPYPNPAVTGAAVAAVTQNIEVRAGSCVVPLHHPARIAEDWAVIDNLTNGRAGIAIASGWQPEDFILRPENTPPANRPALYAAAEQIRKLWRGEAVEFAQKDGAPLAVVTQPRPVRAELPLWLTTAGNPQTWIDAGHMGAHVLTHLLGQTIPELKDKIALYHLALKEAGHDPAAFSVSLMLHSYLASSRAKARARAHGPMKDYLASAVGLVKQYAWAFPAFKKPQGTQSPAQIDLRSLSPQENDAILEFAFSRYFDDAGLFGTVDDALARVEALSQIGVTEIACLIDYGIPNDHVLAGLPLLAEVLHRSGQTPGPQSPVWGADDYSIAAQIIRHGVTHLQCTPSMARMLAMNADSRQALGQIQTMLVGGEALPGALVEDLKSAGVPRLLNMYGPTETTIWSAYAEATPGPDPIASIGRAMANQQLYVLDAARQPVPLGQEGELWIGGEGVARGYWQRPDLTAERFADNPFHPGRMYRSGDLVRQGQDGRIHYIGRTDHQVKLRGHRIELGEIEALLERQPGVSQAVALVREDQPGDLRLVAYVMGGASPQALGLALAQALPAHMLPQHFVSLDHFPLTPNRKVDRKALPAPQIQPVGMPVPGSAAPGTSSAAASAAGGDPLEADLARIWARVLGLEKVGPMDNFFALGGHSLLAVEAHRDIRALPGAEHVSITDIFRYPVLSALAQHLGAKKKGGSLAPLTVAAQVFSSPGQAPAGNNPIPDSLSDAMARRRAVRLARRGVNA